MAKLNSKVSKRYEMVSPFAEIQLPDGRKYKAEDITISIAAEIAAEHPKILRKVEVKKGESDTEM